VDFLRRLLCVEETIVEVSKRHSPTGQRMIVKPYPKDDEPRTIRISPELVEVIAARIDALDLGRDDLLFATAEKAGGAPCLATRSEPRCGSLHSSEQILDSMCGCTTCDMRTHPGSSPAERTSRL
jgi:hypothetical protein